MQIDPKGMGADSVPVHLQRSGDGSLNVKGFVPRPLVRERDVAFRKLASWWGC